jgi:hypothetical protein
MLWLLPRHEQADAQSQTEGFPRKIAYFFGRCVATLDVVRNPLPCARCCPFAPCFARVSRFRGPILTANYKL